MRYSWNKLTDFTKFQISFGTMAVGLLGAAEGLTKIPTEGMRGMIILLIFAVIGIAGALGRNYYRVRMKQKLQNGGDIAIKTLGELGHQQAKVKPGPTDRK